MTERTSYVVSWTRGGLAAGERRTFDEWQPALALYDEVAADRRTVKANLVEVTERERRCYEHETPGRLTAVA